MKLYAKIKSQYKITLYCVKFKQLIGYNKICRNKYSLGKNVYNQNQKKSRVVCYEELMAMIVLLQLFPRDIMPNS